MNTLMIRELIIFEYKNKIAKSLNFTKGINVITSNKENGNDVGKSIILKSIYHTLGADCYFDDMWTKGEKKVYLISVDINGSTYRIYRSNDLFKVYDISYRKLFSTINRQELSVFLRNLYNFAVLLPNRGNNELELTPPAYSYILNFVDQDHMDGSKFNSFKSLGQYADYKENVIYNHFGIFNEEYFETVRNLEKLKNEEKQLNDERQIIETILLRVKKYLSGLDAPGELETLNLELERTNREYLEIVQQLNKIKNSLINLRNQKIELEQSIQDLKKRSKDDLHEVQRIKSDICPTCQQSIDDTELRIKKYSNIEDLYIMKDQLENLLLEVDRNLSIKEEHYRIFLNKLNIYEGKINMDKTNVSNVLKHMGYIKTQDNMIIELGQVEEKIIVNKRNIERHKEMLEKYKEAKAKANKYYEVRMLESKSYFGLQEISNESLKHIKSNFVARGSNKPISTIIWYFNLLHVKYKFNKNAIRFPLVLDSPNNVELDESKRFRLFKYIFDNNDRETQLIVSTLGFDRKEYKDITINNIIYLENEKYSLLNEKDYEKNRDILNMLFND